MSLEDIIQRILSSRPDLTREEVLKKVGEKERKAKGFLTPESAARALARELGVETSEVSLKHGVSIRDLISGLNDVTVVSRVIFIYPSRKFVRLDGTEGIVRHLIVADKTGEMRVVLWDDKADFPNIEELIGRIVKFTHGYIRQGFDGKLELNIGSRGNLETSLLRIPEIEYPPLTHFIKRINDIIGEESVNVLGIVENTYPVVTFKRQDGTEGKVRQIELKDSSGRIRVVLWNDKVEELAEIEKEKCLEIFRAKVRKRLDGYFELHADNSTSIMILSKKPSDF